MADEKVIKIKAEVDDEQLEALGITLKQVSETTKEIDSSLQENNNALDENSGHWDLNTETHEVNWVATNQNTESTNENTSGVDENTGTLTDNTGALDDNATATDNNTEAKNENKSATDENKNATDEDTDSKANNTQTTDDLTGALSVLAGLGIADFFYSCAESSADFNNSMDILTIAVNSSNGNLSDIKSTVSSVSDEMGISGSSARTFASSMNFLGVSSDKSLGSMMENMKSLSYLGGKSFDSLSSSITRMANTGNINMRMLGNAGAVLRQSIEENGQSWEDFTSKFSDATPTERVNMLNEAMSESTTIQEGVSKAGETFESTLTRLDKALAGVTRRLGEPILQTIQPLFELIAFIVGKVVSAFDKLPGPIKDVFGVIILVTGAFGTLFALGSGLVLLMPKIVIGLEAMSTFLGIFAGEGILATISSSSLVGALGTLNTALWTMMANPVVLWLIGISVAIIAIVIAIQYLGRYMGWWDDWSGMVQAFRDGILRLWNAFMNSRIVQAVLSTISKYLNILKSVLTALFKPLTDFWNKMFPPNQGGDVIGGIIDFFSQLESVIIQVYGYLKILWDYFGVFTGVGTLLWILTHLQEIYNALVYIYNGITNLVSQFQQGFNTIMIIVSFFYTYFRTVFNNVYTTVTNIINNIVSYISQLPTKIYNSIKGIIDKFRSVFTEAGKQALNGLKSIPGVSEIMSAVGWAGVGSFKYSVYDDVGSNTGSSTTIINNVQGIVDKYAVDLITQTNANTIALDNARTGK